MAIPVYLQKYKAAGIYRIVFDKSTILGVDAEILRLVVGYSEKGPFNTPVYITSPSEFVAIFGKASRKLEKRGVFFHRLAQQALQAGPILALNLKVFEGEIVGAIGFNPVDLCVHTKEGHDTRLNELEDERNAAKVAYEDALAAFRKAFLKDPNADDSAVTEAVKNYAAAEQAYKDECINRHVSSGDFPAKPISLSVTDIYDTTRFWKLDEKQLENVNAAKTEPVDEKDPYGAIHAVTDESGNVKHTVKGLEGYIRVSATNVASLSNTVVFRKTVDTAALNSYNITVRDWFSDDSEGVPEYLEGYEDRKVSDFLVDMYVFRGKFTSGVTDPSSLGNYIAYAPSQYVNYTDFADTVRFMPYVKNAFGDKLDTLEQLYYDERSNAIAKYTGFTLPYFMDKNGAYQSLDILFNQDNDTHFMMMYFDTVSLENGDIIAEDIIAPRYEVEDADGAFETITRLRGAVDLANDVKAKRAELGTKPFDEKPAEVTKPDKVDAPAELKEVKKPEEVEEGAEGYDQYLIEMAAYENYVSDKAIYDAAKAAYDKYVLDQKAYEDYEKNIEMWESWEAESNTVEAEVAELIKDAGWISEAALNAVLVKEGKNIVGLTSAAKADILGAGINHAVAYLTGYTYEHSLPMKQDTSDRDKDGNRTEKLPTSDDYNCNLWIKNYILYALVKYKGLRVGLCSKADVEYRYIVDTFKSYVDASCKSILCGLAKQKESAFAILNFPAVETFKKHSSKKFIDNTTKQFDVEKLINPANGFSLPGEAEGASFCAFYTPLKFSEAGITSIVPSAALVSNNFMTKYTSRQPYYIVAGQNYGLVTYGGLVGPDYNWSMAELQVIEPYGVNCLLYRPRVGTFINANQTAKQTPKSALSLVNVRELVIYLQDEIEKVLQQYQWEFNTPPVRAKIVDRANYICQQVKNNGGLYDYLNVMDESNNTADIIDNEMCVLSTHIEPGKGCGKMVQELTIYRTGQMRAAISEG